MYFISLIVIVLLFFCSIYTGIYLNNNMVVFLSFLFPIIVAFLQQAIINLIIKKKAIKCLKINKDISRLRREIKYNLVADDFYKNKKTPFEDMECFEKIPYENNIIRFIIIDLDLLNNKIETYKRLILFLKKEIDAHNTKEAFYEKQKSSRNFIVFISQKNSVVLNKMINKSIYITSFMGTLSRDESTFNDCIFPFSIIEEENSLHFGEPREKLLSYEKIKEKIIEFILK